MTPQWHLRHPDPQAVQRLCTTLALAPAVAAVLVNRQIIEPPAVRAFLRPDLDQLPSPETLGGLNRAVARVAEAICQGQRILVFGDYDVDGVTAAALLTDFLTQAGAAVDVFIPHRRRDGYGLQPQHVTTQAARRDCRLIVTVDCGAGSQAAVEAARREGIDVVVTDHHHPGDRPLPATAVVNPRCDGPDSPLAVLAGVGVAFYLVIGLRAHLRRIGFWQRRPEPNLRRLCDLVAIGTVADMVPLVGANRVLTHTGLQVIREGARPGIEALLDISALPRDRVQSEDIAFRLAPRLNAAGRLDHARLALDLLRSADPTAAGRIAVHLDRLNQQRRLLEGEILDDAVARLEQSADLASRRSLVIAGPDWHEGVIGIVASRLARRYHRPAVVLSGRDGLLKGSARSIPGVDIYQAIQAAAAHLEAFGGHPMAAGIQLAPEHRDAFADQFESAVARLASEAVFTPDIDPGCRTGSRWGDPCVARWTRAAATLRQRKSRAVVLFPSTQGL